MIWYYSNITWFVCQGLCAHFLMAELIFPCHILLPFFLDNFFHSVYSANSCHGRCPRSCHGCACPSSRTPRISYIINAIGFVLRALTHTETDKPIFSALRPQPRFLSALQLFTNDTIQRGSILTVLWKSNTHPSVPCTPSPYQALSNCNSTRSAGFWKKA